MLTLALISLMVALDATILVSVLPVSLILVLGNQGRVDADGLTEASNGSRGHRNGCVLGRDFVPAVVRRVPTLHRGAVRHLWAQGAARGVGLVLHAGHRALRPHR